MNLPEYTKRKTLILASVVLLISWVFGYMFLNYQFKSSLQKELDNIANSAEKLFYIKIKEEQKVLEFILKKLLEMEGLSEAIADKNYEKIDFLVSPYYDQLSEMKKDIKILTFRSSEGVTLYRAHKKGFFGDSLNKKRSLILDTNSMQDSFHGFEVGKLAMTYRTTNAIFYNKEYVGSVELGISPKAFIKDLNSIFKIETGIAIDKSYIDIMMHRDGVTIDEKYILIEGGKLLNQYYKDSTKLSNFEVKMNIVLENHLSKTIGFFVLGFDTSAMVKENEVFMYKLLFMGIFIALVLAIVLHNGFNIMLGHFTKQVYTDQLTGLKNRQALKSELYLGKSNVLILSNIKEFSLVNELYGAEIGSEVLKQVAHTFESFAQEHDLVAYRVSSDEYVLLKEEDSFEEDKYDVILDKLHHEINSLHIHIDEIDETLSIDIYSGIAFDRIYSLENAQMAIKKAREKSVPYLAYSQNVDTKKNSKYILGMKKLIKHAIEHKNVIPFFQVITDRDGRVVKYEALARIINFENGEKKIINPDDFLPIAIKSGLYSNLTKEILSRSLSFFANRDEKISINFLPNDFFNVEIMDKFMQLVEEFGSPQKIIVEIIEQEGIEDFQRLLKVVQKLRKIGLLIAIDDFGSGYANYVHILHLKPDYLKIDGSLIKNILESADSKILVKSIIRFAQDLDIKTVAEYVENEEIFELLKEYGVDEFQGYYFGTPQDLLTV